MQTTFQSVHDVAVRDQHEADSLEAVSGFSLFGALAET